MLGLCGCFSPDLQPGVACAGDQCPVGQYCLDAKCVLGTSIEIEIADPADDGEFWARPVDPRWFPDGEEDFDNRLFIGHWDGAAVWGYFRFQLPKAIPASATIVEPTELVLWGRTPENWDDSSDSLFVSATDACNAEVVSESMPMAQGVTDSVRWPAEDGGGLAWQVGTDNAIGSVASLLETLVRAHDGLREGHHVQLWIRGNGGSNHEIATSDSSHLSGGRPARLRVSWR